MLFCFLQVSSLTGAFLTCQTSRLMRYIRTDAAVNISRQFAKVDKIVVKTSQPTRAGVQDPLYPLMT